MKTYIKNLEEETIQNNDYRRVLYTGAYMQLVLMSIEPGENIPEEKHNLDQFIRVESGEGTAIVNGESFELKDDTAIIIPKETMHEIVNTSKGHPLKLYSIYTPPEHPEGTVHTTRAEALEAEAHHHH